MNINYRLAQKSDWTELTRLRNRYSNTTIELDHKHFEQDFEDTEKKNVGPLFVAFHFEALVGYGRAGYFDPLSGKSIYGLRDDAPKGFYLKGLLVEESVRRFGVGKQLTHLRGNWVKEKSDRIYCVLQNSNLPSLKMHEALGYKIIK